MAYDPNNLSALAYANGFTLWHYKTGDAATAVDSAGYFDASVNMIRTGDFLFANVDLDDSPQHGLFVVLSNDGTTVNVANLTQWGVIDTD